MPRETLVTKAIRMGPALIANLEREAGNNDMNFSEYVREILFRRSPRQLSHDIKKRRRHAGSK